MLIFKDICHYDPIINSAKEFRSRFKKTLRRIRKRGDLRKDPILFGMAVMDLEIQMTANLISKMREETKEIKKRGWKKLTFYKPLLKAYRYKDRELQMEVDKKLETKLRAVALEVLDSANQIHFLEYTAALDAAKITGASGANKYKHEAITHYKFDKVFWPVNEEYWFDELEDYSENGCFQTLPHEDIAVVDKVKIAHVGSGVFVVVPKSMWADDALKLHDNRQETLTHIKTAYDAIMKYPFA